MNYKQGDIILVWFPESNLINIKKRPAIILQANNLQTELEQLIIGMITSNLNRANHKSRIFVDIKTKIGRQTGLLANSVIMTDNIATVKTKEIYKKIGFFENFDILKKCLRNTFAI